MKKEEMYQQIKNYIENTDGFIKHNGMHVSEITDTECTMYIDLSENSLNPNGTAHGGLIFGLADTTMGLLARTTGRNVVTINSQIDYLKPCKGSKITCVAEALKVGKTTAVYRSNIYNEDNILAATVTGTYFFID